MAWPYLFWTLSLFSKVGSRYCFNLEGIYGLSESRNISMLCPTENTTFQRGTERQPLSLETKTMVLVPDVHLPATWGPWQVSPFCRPLSSTLLAQGHDWLWLLTQVHWCPTWTSHHQAYTPIPSRCVLAKDLQAGVPESYCRFCFWGTQLKTFLLQGYKNSIRFCKRRPSENSSISGFLVCSWTKL